MQNRLVGVLRGAGSTFSQFSTPQKMIAAIGIAVLVLGGAAFMRWASTPTLQPLFTNLAASDASAIVDQLDSEGVTYELADGGSSILVPQTEVYRMRLAMSSAGLPASADTGYALLDEQGVTASQFQQQVTWQRALQGELARTISSIQGVEAATVNLAIPAKDVFLDETAAPTGSVLVETRPGAELPAQQVQSIVHLVASSVEGLSPDDVTVVDGDGRLLSAAGSGGGAAGGLRDQQTTDYETRVSSALQAVLDTVVGPGNGFATVTADLDFDSTDRTSETFSAPEDTPPLSSSTTSEQYTGGGGAATGVLGPDNIQVPSGTGDSDSSYTKTSTTENNSVNKVTERTSTAPGSLRRQSVSVVVNSRSVGDLDITALRDAVTAAAGIDAERGDVLSVSRMPFDTSSAEAAGTALEEAKAAAAAEQKGELIRTGAIAGAVVLLAIVVLLLTLKRRKKVRRDEIDLGEMRVLEPGPGQRELDRVDEDDPRSLLPRQRTPDSAERRSDVIELVERQPDDVAELLRGWLADRRA